jgi:hypothetical protein
VIEMSCPRAFLTRANSFLEQYSGKELADMAKLEEKVKTIAKATGSSKLTNDTFESSAKGSYSSCGSR